MTDRLDQLEFLLSRRLDERLSPADQAALEAALREEPSLADVARQYDRISILLSSWRPLDARSVNWPALSSRISANITGDTRSSSSSPDHRAASSQSDDPALGPIDDLLAQWAAPLPDVDWSAFHSRVSAAVRRESVRSILTAKPHAQHSRLFSIARFALPLAAAAAIAFAFWWPSSPSNTPVDPSADSRKTMIIVDIAEPESVGSVFASFQQDTPAPESTDQPEPAGAAAAFGNDASTHSSESAESEEEVFFY